MLLSQYNQEGFVEAGVDEAGRGCLAGDVYAAAVILPPDYHNEVLNDSKQLTPHQRYALREVIERDAVAWAVGVATVEEIDRINILNAAILAMHRAIEALKVKPQFLIIDGNRFKPYFPGVATTGNPTAPSVPYTTIVKGDGKYLSIAAASILAKTYRDDCMMDLHRQFPYYGWDHNAGYPTREHQQGIAEHGITPYHRLTFGNLAEIREKTLFDLDEDE